VKEKSVGEKNLSEKLCEYVDKISIDDALEAAAQQEEKNKVVVFLNSAISASDFSAEDLRGDVTSCRLLRLCHANR
jgi:hypothetical protein